jgi:flavin reductase (DIM6/NTAB) family NADH-FMN oxidoreductase RutF
MNRLRAQYASGVTVVTFRTPEGLRGVTVASFAIASIEPPMVLFCLERGLESNALVSAAGAFGVSLLADAQEFLSQRFAALAPVVDAEFSGVPYFTRRTGAPLLEGAVAWFDCVIDSTVEVGDHRLFLGRVEWGEVSPTPRDPLLYFARMYSTVDRLRLP